MKMGLRRVTKFAQIHMTENGGVWIQFHIFFILWTDLGIRVRPAGVR